jgi:hypothetical protein
VPVPVGIMYGCTGWRAGGAVGIGPGMTIGVLTFLSGGGVMHTGGTPEVHI